MGVLIDLKKFLAPSGAGAIRSAEALAASSFTNGSGIRHLQRAAAGAGARWREGVELCASAVPARKYLKRPHG